MKTNLVIVVMWLSAVVSALSQEHSCNYLNSKMAALSSSSDQYGLMLYDSINGNYIFSTGEIKRIIAIEGNSFSIDLHPFNPFTKKEQFMYGVSFHCNENEYCLEIDSIMNPPTYFKNLETLEPNKQNADSLGYYYVYMLLLTREEHWVWKVQKAMKCLSADGSFFLILDLLRDMHLISYKSYKELYIGDALHRPAYCKKFENP